MEKQKIASRALRSQIVTAVDGSRPLLRVTPPIPFLLAHPLATLDLVLLKRVLQLLKKRP